jgi:hypothetical protein
MKRQTTLKSGRARPLNGRELRFQRPQGGAARRLTPALEQNPSFVGTDAPLAQAARLHPSAHRSGVSLNSVPLDL